MKPLYYVETLNNQSEILIFTSQRKAEKWLRRATRWTKDHIKKAIQPLFPIDGRCHIFPTTKGAKQ